MDPLTIFYSWQSDLPNKTNRGFIQQALETAVQDLNRGDAVAMELAVDRDTQNTHGAKHIADSILDKIQRAAIFVCDISFINSESSNPEGQNRPRLTPNPNVLIELGYALHVLGYDRILLVFNNAFGKVDDLPFDIRFRRVIQYTSHETDIDRAPQRKKLTDDFKRNLPAMLKSVETTRHTTMQELIDRASEFHKQRVAFVNRGEDCLEVNETKPFLLLHVIPLNHHGGEDIVDLTNEEVLEECYIVHPLMALALPGDIVGDGVKNKIKPKTPDEKDGEYRRSYAHVFVDGTIEFADVYLISDAPWTLGNQKQKGFRIPEIDSALIKATRRAMRFYKKQNITAPVAIFLSLCNAQGLSILMDRHVVGRPLPNNETLTFKGKIIENIQAPNAVETALKPVLDKVYQYFGLPGARSYRNDGSLDPKVAEDSKLY